MRLDCYEYRVRFIKKRRTIRGWEERVVRILRVARGCVVLEFGLVGWWIGGLVDW